MPCAPCWAQMDIESSLFLEKARESLASAAADFAAGRYNSCANRAYYAAFQAAVAALIYTGVRRRGRRWEHRHVIAEVSGTLVRRRHLLPAAARISLSELLEARRTADYAPTGLSRRASQRGLRQATLFVQAVSSLVER